MIMKKIIFGILALGIIIGGVFIISKSKNKITDQSNVVKMQDVPVEVVKDGQSPTLDFGKIVTMDLSSQVVFSDTLNVKLKEINDSRCPAGVQCIWAGELSIVLQLSGGNLKVPKEIILGTVRNKEVILEGYTFSLKDMTKTNASITVVKN